MSRHYSLEEKILVKECARLIIRDAITLEEAYDKIGVPNDDHRLSEQEVEEILLSFN